MYLTLLLQTNIRVFWPINVSYYHYVTPWLACEYFLNSIGAIILMNLRWTSTSVQATSLQHSNRTWSITMLSTATFYILKPLSVSVGYQRKPAISAPSSGHKFLESQKPGEAMQTSFFSIARALMCTQKPDFLILWFSPTVNFSFPPHPQRKEKKNP